MPSRVVPCRVYKKALKSANVVQSSEEDSVASALNDSSKSAVTEAATGAEKAALRPLSLAAAPPLDPSADAKPRKSGRPGSSEAREPAPPTPIHIKLIEEKERSL